MHSSLAERVEQVRRKALWLVWLHGLARFAAAAMAVLMALCLLDYLLRLNDPIGRWLLSIAAVGLIGWLLAKLTLPALRYHQDRVQVAQGIERRFPQLDERLSSAVAFLAQSAEDATAGSPELRRAVVAQAESISSGIDFGEVLDKGAPRRASLITAAAFGVLMMLVLINPPAASLALGRLTMPWRNAPWPRRHELAVVEAPRRLAAGDACEIVVIDRRGQLPNSVQLLLRFEGPDGAGADIREMKRLTDRMVLRLNNVRHSFAYRAVGGDDDTMAWNEVTIVDPPNIVELEVVVEPPAYSGLPPARGGRVIQALVGSTLHVSGRLDKPIASAQARSETPGLPLPAVRLAPDGMSFRAPAENSAWVIERSGAVSFELTDRHGLAFGRDTRIELRAVSDSPPDIGWEAPSEEALVSRGALIPVKAVVKDDLGLRAVQLRYLRPGESDQEETINIFAGASNAGRPLDGESQPIDYRWDLSELVDLQPGDVLMARLTAEDSKGQVATTAVRRLTVIAASELASRLATRQAAFLSQLAEALRLARQAREQTSAIEDRLRHADQLVTTDLNQLQTIHYNQRQVQRLLGDTSEGVEGQIAALLAEMVANRLQNQPVGPRLEELLFKVREVNRPDKGGLPAIEQQLTQAFKAARAMVDGRQGLVDAEPSQSPPAEVVARLSAARESQDEVIHSLERMLGALTEWDTVRRLSRELAQIRIDEQRVAKETERLKLTALGAFEVSPADRAAAQLQSELQLELARQIDKLQLRMHEMHSQPQGHDPSASASLSKALEAAQALAVGGQMREVASQLRQLHFGQAQQSAELVLEVLKQLEGILATGQANEITQPNTDSKQPASQPPQGTTDRGNPSERAGSGISNDGAGGASRPQPGPKVEIETADVKELMARAWGHLPDKLREQMHGSLSEQFLPKYERLIEEYYKRLAEEGGGRP